MADPLPLPPWGPLGSSSVLVTPPTEEPITLEEAKLRAGLDWPTTEPPDPRDQLMRDFIAAARAQVEKDTELALLTQVRDLYFSTVTPSGGLAGPGQAFPLQEVIDVWPVDEAGGLGASVRGRVRVIGSRVPRAVAWAGALPAAGVVVRAKVGWLDAADLRMRAPLLLHAVGLLTAHYATAGRDAVVVGTSAEPNPLAYEDAIAPYRLIWVA